MLSCGYKGTCFCLWPVFPGLELQPSPLLSLSGSRPTDSPSLSPSSTLFCICVSWRHLPYNSSLWVAGYISLQTCTHTYRHKCAMQQMHVEIGTNKCIYRHASRPLVSPHQYSYAYAHATPSVSLSYTHQLR